MVINKEPAGGEMKGEKVEFIQWYHARHSFGSPLDEPDYTYMKPCRSRENAVCFMKPTHHSAIFPANSKMSLMRETTYSFESAYLKIPVGSHKRLLDPLTSTHPNGRRC